MNRARLLVSLGVLGLAVVTVVMVFVRSREPSCEDTMRFALQPALVGPGAFELQVSGPRYAFRCGIEPLARRASCTGDSRSLQWQKDGLGGFSVPLWAVRATPLDVLTSRDGVPMSKRRLRAVEGQPVMCRGLAL